jgi:predicted translation initiation factor SUI1
MAKSEQVILFLNTDAAKSSAAAEAFSAAANRLGLPWSVRSYSTLNLPLAHLYGVSVIVAVDDLSIGNVHFKGRQEFLETTHMEEAVNRLIARLLGGDDRAVIPETPTRPAPPKKVHTVKLSRETAGRKGKGVTVVSELPLTGDQLKDLATKLKNACGTGGTAKDGRIEIQGDQRDRVAVELEKLGYKVKRAGG